MQTKLRKRLLVLWILTGVLCLAGCGILGYYYYDTHVDRSGWEMQHDQYYYRDFHHRRVSGWQDIDGKRYYFDPETGMQTGWITLGGLRYYLDTDGSLYRGWLSQQDGDYYLDGSGAMVTGLLPLDGKLYFLDPEGRRVSGFQTLGEQTYYFTRSGPAHVGPLKLQEDRYFFRPDGTMVTGWLHAGDRDYYFLPEGPVAQGLLTVEDQTYYFGDQGYAVHGWVDLGEYSYCFGPDGTALTGPQELGGETHYFTPQGIHVVLVNRDHPIPDYYDPDVVTLFNWNLISRVALEPMLQMLKDCESAGNPYTFNSSYRTHQNQIDIVDKRTEEYMNRGMPFYAAYAKTLETAAVPGTSEHEMGLAADIVGKEANQWLAEHCWEYGFILRYPPEKAEITGISYEPWHFRYVGTAVSLPMRDSGLCLEEFLGAPPVK